jgi:16S rRNA C1402 (ribose-2'-O) methylase RsmI
MEPRTMVFYESPLRLVKTLEEMMAYFGEERACCVSRELTKIYEENQRGSLREVCEHFRQQGVKGEIVIVVEGVGRVRGDKVDGGDERDGDEERGGEDEGNGEE